mgnify:CR=1 FL=1
MVQLKFPMILMILDLKQLIILYWERFGFVLDAKELFLEGINHDY